MGKRPPCFGKMFDASTSDCRHCSQQVFCSEAQVALWQGQEIQRTKKKVLSALTSKVKEPLPVKKGAEVETGRLQSSIGNFRYGGMVPPHWILGS